ncbi:bacterial low temperature requirement A protein-domain-containing protein [Stachybotrys elegans]|uniref:Bacterial low temperature requirement A protein-domain-containing protein n=1 Tax=Stachybotrys elegans TaxID=80388 RepID=A0A8K0WLA0_9HYPO|nr:bacterial low temperature requirement A protein-domain-containing protein [Stachybotrys elegans]
MIEADHGGSVPKSTQKPSGFSSNRATLRFASSKLNLVNNPISRADGVEETRNLLPGSNEYAGSGSAASISSVAKEPPLEFYKRESASTSELFYDLWFVANLTVFVTVHPITETSTLASFVIYFTLLWITWLVTTVFDARFGQDGILERLARACHLTVMIAFAMLSPSFGEPQVIMPIFRAASIFLMMSRIVLAYQYAIVLFHARNHRRSRVTLFFAVLIPFAASLMYMMSAFIPANYSDHRLYIIWYVVGMLEMAALVIHATFSETLTFAGTHFNERLSLLTLIILGEGVIILAKNVGKIVEYTFVKEVVDGWSASLIGIILSAACTLYITYQLYFDWMHHHSHMPVIHQAFWTIIHLPLHIALVLLVEGGSQWSVWWRAIEAFRETQNHLFSSMTEAMTSEKTSAVADALRTTATHILKQYGGYVDEDLNLSVILDEAIDSLMMVPDSFWGNPHAETSPEVYRIWYEAYTTISSLTMTQISDVFELDVDESKQFSSLEYAWDAAEQEAIKRTLDGLLLLFVYMFVCAGAVLGLLMLMHLLSKQRGWSWFNIIRTTMVFAIGLALGLVALTATNPTLVMEYLLTAWQVPVVTGCYLFVLLLTHLPHPPRISFRYGEVRKDVELGPVPDEQNSLHASAQDDVARPLRRGMTFKQGLSQMHRAAKNIHIEPGRYEPIAEGGLFFPRRSTIDIYGGRV